MCDATTTVVELVVIQPVIKFVFEFFIQLFVELFIQFVFEPVIESVIQLIIEFFSIQFAVELIIEFTFQFLDFEFILALKQFPDPGLDAWQYAQQLSGPDSVTVFPVTVFKQPYGSIQFSGQSDQSIRQPTGPNRDHELQWSDRFTIQPTAGGFHG